MLPWKYENLYKKTNQMEIKIKVLFLFWNGGGVWGGGLPLPRYLLLIYS